MNNRSSIGELVESIQGRDKGQIFMVYKITKDGDYYLVNGDNRTFKSPKLKNGKHIKALGFVATHLKEKLEQNKCIYDNEIYSCIKKYKEN